MSPPTHIVSEVYAPSERRREWTKFKVKTEQPEMVPCNPSGGLYQAGLSGRPLEL